MSHSKHIVIIGGGFSGTLTAIHLAHGNTSGQVRITVINPTPNVGCGLAYQFDDENLLLNVPAGNMSALADDPSHFVSYCQRIDPSLSSGSFVSRRLYGYYLQDTLAQSQAARPGVIETLADEAVALNRDPEGTVWCITLASGQQLTADHVILATGHQAPRFPIPLGPEERECVIDPWDFSAMQRLPSGQPVFIVGTGHTAVDALFCLTQSQPRRQVYMLSRHGLLPHRHRPTPTPPKSHALPDYLRSVPATVLGYTKAFRQHVKEMASQGMNWRDALNELRPHTPALWQSLPAVEQRRFLRHLQAYWDVHRHRLAPMAAQRLDSLRAEGQVETLAGRILSVKKRDDGISVELQHRGTELGETVHASALINCTGPNTDIRRNASPLLAQMLQAGLIQVDVHGLGLMVTPDQQVLDAQQQPVEDLWYVGPMLKAQRWEATAVPELRVHTQQLAHRLLARLSHPIA